MPKMKTRKSAQKRFSLTASGKVKRRKMNLKHILEKKSPKRKAAAGKQAYVHVADEPRIKRMLPNG